jgi:hypothetical protein
MKVYSIDLPKKIVRSVKKGISKSETALLLLEQDHESRPWATHRQRREFLYGTCGVEVSEATICRQPSDASLTAEKSSTAASERDEWLRLVWRFVVGKLDHERLVFVDEIGLTPRLLSWTATHPAVGGRSPRYRETGARTRLYKRVSAAREWGLL